MSRISMYVVLSALVILVLLILGITLDRILDFDLALAPAVVGSGIIVFCSCIIISEERGINFLSDSAIIRSTISVSIVIEYLVLVGTVALFSTNPNEPERLPAVTQTLLTNFTAIVGVVVAFFFGSSAYVEGQERRGRRSQAEKPAVDGERTP